MIIYRDENEDDVIVQQKQDFWWGYIGQIFLTWSSKPSGMNDFKQVDLAQSGIVQKLKADAKNKFPVGTVFKNGNIMIATNKKKVINSSQFNSNTFGNGLKITNYSDNRNTKHTIFRDGAWAKIIESPYMEKTGKTQNNLANISAAHKRHEYPLTPKECYPSLDQSMFITGTGGNIDGIDFKNYWDSIPTESNHVFPKEKIQKQIDTITLRKNIVLLLP